MSTQLQVVAVVATLFLLGVVLELVRQRRLLERYALLWLFSAVVLLGFGVWRGALEGLADVIGIAYPPSALFVMAVFFILVLLLHFSVAVSRLSEQSKVLAQRLALLEQAQREQGDAVRALARPPGARTRVEAEAAAELERSTRG